MNKGHTVCSDQASRSGSFQMTQKVDYALFLLTVLAKFSEHTSLRSIAERNHLSFAFLQKVARLLRSADIIKSARGREGGYTLAKSSAHILFRDIVLAVEGQTVPHACLSERRTSHACPRKALCSIRPALQRLHTQMQQLYLSKPLTYFLHKQ
ncbi:MAG: Rrf2 family transcriptional regulator [Patescibacteria group bacterium]